MKRAFKYRFYPTEGQAAELSRTFGCVRLVSNRALAERTTAWYTEQRRLNYNHSSAALAEWKRDSDLAFLNEVSSVPLQQGLRHLQTAFRDVFDKRARYPRFKSKKASRSSAEYTRSGFKYRNGNLALAKMSEPLDIVWSRPLPERAEPFTVTVSRDRVPALFHDQSTGSGDQPFPHLSATFSGRRRSHTHLPPTWSFTLYNRLGRSTKFDNSTVRREPRMVMRPSGITLRRWYRRGSGRAEGEASPLDSRLRVQQAKRPRHRWPAASPVGPDLSSRCGTYTLQAEKSSVLCGVTALL